MASADPSGTGDGSVEEGCKFPEEIPQNGKIKTLESVENNPSPKTVNGAVEKEESFDLTNPDILLQQLEKVDLTEEDTEELLHEAYKVNMKLKEILRRQQAKESKRRERMSSAQSAYSSSTKSNRAHGASVLPPIQKKSSATDRSRRLSESKQSSSSNISRDSAKSRSDDIRHPKRSSTRRSAKEKPAWDDRFSYS